jgi:hypothetical protein
VTASKSALPPGLRWRAISAVERRQRGEAVWRQDAALSREVSRVPADVVQAGQAAA